MENLSLEILTVMHTTAQKLGWTSCANENAMKIELLKFKVFINDKNIFSMNKHLKQSKACLG